jgi:branched-chain amino acid transport system substrate-binding protein
MHVKAIENAIKAKGSADITGTDVRDGMRAIKDFSLDGLLPPLQLSAKDHEGGGYVRIFQVQKGKYVPVTDWYRAYREDVLQLLEEEHKG